MSASETASEEASGAGPNGPRLSPCGAPRGVASKRRSNFGVRLVRLLAARAFRPTRGQRKRAQHWPPPHVRVYTHACVRAPVLKGVRQGV